MRESLQSFNDVMRATQRRRYETASPYDFRQGEKFSADQNRFLEKLFVSFAESVVTLLAPLLQTRFQMELVSIKPRTYQAYLNSLPDPTPILVFRLEPDFMGFLDMDFDLSFALFDKLMGGKGVPPRDEVRPFFTELEKAILQKPLLKMLEAYSEAWHEVKEVRPQFMSLEFNPMAVHIGPPSETMVITSFQADVAHAQGLVNVCLPFRYLKNAIPRSSFDEFMLTKSSGGVTQTQAQVVAPIFAKNLEAAKVPVSISLGRAEILFQDLLTIEVGDTIRLDTEIAAALRIKVNEKTKFLGQPGIKDGRMAAKVIKVLQEGDEEFDE